MSTIIEAPLQPGALPAGYCWPSDPQKYLNDIMAISRALYPVGVRILVRSDTAPGASERNTTTWIRTIGGDDEYMYDWSDNYGAWISLYPMPASSALRLEWEGTEPDLVTYDGGDGNVPSDISGPFWEVDHNYDQVIGIGPGTLPGPPAVPIAVGGTGGIDQITLAIAQFVHFHGTARSTVDAGSIADANMLIKRAWASAGQHLLAQDWMDSPAQSDYPSDTGDLGTTDPLDTATPRSPVNIMPPYRGIYKIKRTPRKYRIAS